MSVTKNTFEGIFCGSHTVIPEKHKISFVKAKNLFREVITSKVSYIKYIKTPHIKVLLYSFVTTS